MKFIFCLVAILWLSAVVAQKIHPLSVGDPVPDMVLHNIINAGYTSARLSDHSGKLVILDFFATTCGACINALPRMDSLQKRFHDSLTILVTCYESAATIRRFLQNNPKAKNSSLAFVTSDSLLSKTFPHYLIPHEVWLRNQKVLAITEAEIVTAASIQKVLSNRIFLLPVKTDLMDFNPDLSILSQLDPRDTTLFLHQSLLTSYVDGLGIRRGSQVTGNHKRVYFINWGILSLFQYAWGFSNNRIVLDVSSPADYLDKTTDPVAWKKHNLYSYEGSFPASCPDSLIKAALRATLQSAAPWKGAWEKREMPCYVLTKEGEGPPPSTLTKTTFHKDPKTDSLYLLHHSLAAITAICNDASQPTPGKPIVINETGIPYPIDLVIPAASLQDPIRLAKALILYQLSITATRRVLDVFVLTDNH